MRLNGVHLRKDSEVSWGKRNDGQRRSKTETRREKENTANQWTNKTRTPIHIAFIGTWKIRFVDVDVDVGVGDDDRQENGENNVPHNAVLHGDSPSSYHTHGVSFVRQCHSFLESAPTHRIF